MIKLEFDEKAIFKIVYNTLTSFQPIGYYFLG